MAIKGMYAGQLAAYNFGSNLSSVSFTLKIPPANAFSQVHLADYYEFDDKSAAEVAIVQVKNSQGQTKSFPDPDSVSSWRVVFESNMTSITFRMRAKEIWAFYVFQVFLF
jgi:hypothetical protein